MLKLRRLQKNDLVPIAGIFEALTGQPLYHFQASTTGTTHREQSLLNSLVGNDAQFLIRNIFHQLINATAKITAQLVYVVGSRIIAAH